MKFDGDVLQVIANLEQLRRLYRSAYEFGYARERRQWEKTTGTRDAGGPTAVVAAEQETIREKLRTVADLVTGDKGAKGAASDALRNLRSLADRGRHVARDWEVHPGEYATTERERKRIRPTTRRGDSGPEPGGSGGTRRAQLGARMLILRDRLRSRRGAALGTRPK